LADIEADDEERRDVEARELLGVVPLRERRIPRIRDLEQPEMLEAAADPRELRQLAVLQHLGIAGGEGRTAGIDRLDRGRFVVEERDEQRVRAVRVRQRLKTRLQALL